MSGATIGAWDIVARFVAILETYLQDKLDELTDAAGVSWSLSVVDVIKGHTETTVTRANVVYVYERRSAYERDQMQNYGGPVRETTEIGIRANVMHKSLSLVDLDSARSIYAAAIESVLAQHWRAAGNPAHLFWVETRAEHGQSSTRRSAGVLGLVAQRLGFGGGGQDTIDPIEVVATCRQFVARPVDLT